MGNRYYPMKKIKRTKRLIRAALDKWLKPLGLLWWDVRIIFIVAPEEILDIFQVTDDEVTAAKCYADWRYGTAKIYVNVPGCVHMSQEEIERMLVHEMCHVLVNEMREGELHHEERVVSALTKVMFWVREGMTK